MAIYTCIENDIGGGGGGREGRGRQAGWLSGGGASCPVSQISSKGRRGAANGDIDMHREW